MSVERGESRQEFDNNTEKFVNAAKREAVQWVNKGRPADKVNKAIERRFGAYVEENAVIARGFSTPSYLGHVEETRDFLNTRIGAVLCSDGRLVSPFFIPPRIGGTYRKPGGLPETNISSFFEHRELSDPIIKGAIASAVKQRLEEGKNPQVVEIVGGHFDTERPEHHGCGALGLHHERVGRNVPEAMRHGAISDFINLLGKGFDAFDKIAENAGGKGDTISAFQDTHTMGFVAFLKENAFDESTGEMKFDKKKSLRENLIFLHNKKKDPILMTELTDSLFEAEINRLAEEKGIREPLNMRDPKLLAKNLRLTGEIAMEITGNLDKKIGYDWIPQNIRDGRSEDTIRTLAYLFIRNSTIRKLGNITPGKHSLVEHPEQLFRVGPIGAEYNVNIVPFIEATTEGRIQSQDIEGVRQLYRLSAGIFPKMGINLNEEARVIVATGMFDGSIYNNKNEARTRFETTASRVRSNARIIREEFKEAVREGDVVVIPALYEPHSRRLSHVLEPKVDL